MNNIITLTKIEFKKYFRQPIVVAFGIVFPIFWTIMNGAIFGNTPSVKLGGYGTVDFMFSAYIFMVILVFSLSSTPIVLAKNYEMKAIERYSFSPIKKYEYLFTLIISNIIIALVSSIVIFMVSLIAFKITAPNIQYIFAFVIATIFLSATMTSIGVLLASSIKSFQSALSVSLLLYFFLLFFTGATVPLPVLPTSIINIAKFIPFTRMVYLLQNIWLVENTDLIINLITSLVMTIVFVSLAIKFFRWDH